MTPKKAPSGTPFIMRKRNFIVSLIFTEITKVTTSPNTEIGVVHVYAPAQYLSEIEKLIRAKFGALKAYNIKPDKKNPYLQVRTGKATNILSNEIYNWLNQQRSQVYYDNPTLSPNYSASEQGFDPVSGEKKKEEAKEEEAKEKNNGKDNTLLYIVGGVILLVIMMMMKKNKK